MCDKPGFLHGMIISGQADRALAKHEQKIRQEAIRSVLGEQPKRGTLTEKAETMLVVVGGIVLLASAQLIVHVLAITLAVLAGLLIGALAAAVAVAIRRRRRARPETTASLPAAPVRAVVTDVRRRAVGSRPPLSGPAAIVRSRAAGRR